MGPAWPESPLSPGFVPSQEAFCPSSVSLTNPGFAAFISRQGTGLGWFLVRPGLVAHLAVGVGVWHRNVSTFQPLALPSRQKLYERFIQL